MLNTQIPSEHDAIRILKESLGKDTDEIHRFPTGLANWVYDVRTKDGQNFVVRLARADLKYFFEGALHWYKPLMEKGVPLPILHYSELDESVHGFPVMIMDRLPGKDLGEAYETLSDDEKREIADKISGTQKAVAELPMGRGYGYARSANDSKLHQKWTDVLQANLMRSKSRFEEKKIFPLEFIDRMQSILRKHENYFSSIKPICFLDDTTTKNVIIDQGKLSGIVDADSVAYGDPLLTLALTKMALLERGFDTVYTDHWEAKLALDAEQKEALHAYTALFCVDFMSGVGQQFNKTNETPIDPKEVQKYSDLFESLDQGL